MNAPRIGRFEAEPLGATDGLDDAGRIAATRAILAGRDTDAVWAAFADAAAACGFTRLLYGCLDRPADGEAPRLEGALMLARGPQRFLDIYVDDELYRASPMVAWITRNAGFASNAEIAASMRIEPTPELMRLMQLRLEYQSGQGIVGSFLDAVPGVLGGISLHCHPLRGADEVMDLWECHGPMLETMAGTMHLRIATLPHPQLRPLTTRQREALTWVSRGKTGKDIAAIMNLSEPTVEKHLRGAREALDAVTTAHAVRRAMEMKLLAA